MRWEIGAPTATVREGEIATSLPTASVSPQKVTGERELGSTACGVLIAQLVKRGYDEVTIAGVIGAHPSGIGSKYADRADLDQEIARVRAKIVAGAGRGRNPSEEGPTGGAPEQHNCAEASTAEDSPNPRTRGFSMEKMNGEFAFVLVGAKAVILWERPDAPLEQRIRLLSVGAFRQWSLNRFTKVAAGEGRIKEIRWAEAWLSSYRRREYDGIEFYPDPENALGTRGYFNLWRGFDVAPATKPNSYRTFQDHLLNNVCNGSEDLYNWVFGFFAHIVQRPRERLGVALVFRGGRGWGKTKIGEVFGSLIASHYFLVDNPRYLVGQFNVHLANCLLLQADEAVWAGDKAAEGRLKGLITAPDQMIEAKGIDPIRIKNYVRVVMTSNEDWVVPAGKDERRYVVLDLDPRCAQNHDYFSEMEIELANGGREALLADLLAFDLSSVNLRQAPLTEALLEQKILSLDSIDSWWFDRLQTGAPMRALDEWVSEVPVNALYQDYIAASDEVGIRRKHDRNTFGKHLSKLVPGLSKRRPRSYVATWPPREGDNSRPWIYVLPSLSDCREAFEASVAQAISWPREDP